MNKTLSKLAYIVTVLDIIAETSEPKLRPIVQDLKDILSDLREELESSGSSPPIGSRVRPGCTN